MILMWSKVQLDVQGLCGRDQILTTEVIKPSQDILVIVKSKNFDNPQPKEVSLFADVGGGASSFKGEVLNKDHHKNLKAL